MSEEKGGPGFLTREAFEKLLTRRPSLFGAADRWGKGGLRE